MNLNNLSIIEKDRSEKAPAKKDAFLETNLLWLNKEGNLFSDAETALLPTVKKSHPGFRQWKTKKQCLKRLMRNIAQKDSPVNILEIGCGNGWLSAQLARVTAGMVVGIDISAQGIAQAKRVFGNIPNLTFMLTDFRRDCLPVEKFDLVVISASIEYFSSFAELINMALNKLTLMGEIHIVASRLYQQEEIVSARNKQRAGFVSLGVPSMSRYYFLHTLEDLASYHFKILFDPNHWMNKLIPGSSNQHHILIKNHYN